jgi:Na+/H+-dicarboxylate symporter
MDGSHNGPGKVPLWLQVALAVVLGAVIGSLARGLPSVGAAGVVPIGELGMLVIRALKMLAVPLVAFVVLDAVLRFEVSGAMGARLLRICAVNGAVAMAIGVVVINVLRPGEQLRGLFTPVLAAWGDETAAAKLSSSVSLDGLLPKSVAGPFVDNNVLGAALLALVLGFALRSVRRSGEVPSRALDMVADAVNAVSEALQRALSWLVLLAPIAAFALVTHAVAHAGLAAFAGLWIFVAAIALGFTLHGLVFYSFRAWSAGMSPRRFLAEGRDAVVMAIATNSSLATVPVTLRCLVERMGVSQPSARLAACVGTNLNNDGIALYEAMTVLTIAQACGLDLDLAQQGSVVLASVLAGAGIAGIPEAGIVVLPTVLAAIGVPEAAAMAAIPLVMPVDWLLARARTVLNVLSDMIVAILLDARPR